MALYYFRAFLNGKEVPLVGFTVNATNSNLTIDVTLPSNQSYADVGPGSVIEIKYGSKLTKFTEGVYAGFSAAKTSYQYSQTLQFLHPINILLNAPFSFPITTVSTSVYEYLPDYVLYKLTGGKDLGTAKNNNIPSSFFSAIYSGNVKNLLDFFNIVRQWSTSFDGLCKKYLDKDVTLKASLSSLSIDVSSSANMLALLSNANRFDTPSFIDMQWVLNTLLMYTNQAIFCQPDGTLSIGLADGITLPAPVKIRQADIEQVNIMYSWIQPNSAVAFLSQGESQMDLPMAAVVYSAYENKCVSGYSFDTISGIAANTTFGNYSPVSISVSVPFLSQEELNKAGMTTSTEQLYDKACSFAKRHYWRLYKTTNSYELIVPFGIPQLMGNVVGRTCAFGLNNKIFFGQVVGVSHSWNANAESYSKITVQGVRGYEYSSKDNIVKDYYDLINPDNKITVSKDYESSALPDRTMTIF